MGWAVVVPVKRLAEAKSRLVGYPAEDRARLALAFAVDTLAAVREVVDVDLLVVVTADAAVRDVVRDVLRDVVRDGALLVEEPPGLGLNRALEAGVSAVTAARPDLSIAAVVADLPALRATDLTAALASAAGYQHAFVADAGGSGTTLLTAAAGQPLHTAFGASSAARHERLGATAIGGPLRSLRRDVDTEADLAAALELGVGPATLAVLSR